MSARFTFSLSILLAVGFGPIGALVACGESEEAMSADAGSDASVAESGSTDASIERDSDPPSNVTDASSDADAFVTHVDQCDDDNLCTIDSISNGACVHAVATGGTTCRPAVGGCDVEERCDGTTTVCPVDSVAGTSTVCRTAAAICDAEETCDGVSKTCGTDKKKTPIAVGATGGNLSSVLYSINAETGAVLSTIGAMGLTVNGLAQHPMSGVLYGVTAHSLAADSESLITINPATGAPTLIAGIGSEIADISFDAMGNLYGWNLETNRLVHLNTSTAVATNVGNTTIITNGAGIAFDTNGTLFFAGDGVGGALRTLNITTGLSTDLAKMTGFQTGTDGSPIFSLAMHPITNVLYGVQGGASSASYIFAVDKATSAIAKKGASIMNLRAFTFICSP